MQSAIQVLDFTFTFTYTVRQDLTSDGSEFQVCGAATEKDRRAFLGRSAAGRRMTAEDELEQLSGSGRSSTLALRRTSSWTLEYVRILQK